jgi:hypothetical protein
MWIGVSQRFSQFYSNLLLTTSQVEDGLTKQAGVRACLSRHYWPLAADAQANSLMVGSWGKQTQVRPPFDVDVLFVLPYEVYQRIEQNVGNKQSALLQEVKGVLQETYPQTTMRGDGQVVVVSFNTVVVEVAPVFRLQNGQHWICDTNDGGRYRTIDPLAELKNIEDIHIATYRHLRPVVQMAKVWKEYCNVPLPSFQIELIAGDFIKQCEWRVYDWFYYDWIMRDFFAFVITRANGWAFLPGTREVIALGDAWKSRAESAFERAKRACDWEKYDCVATAGDEWQWIFGTMIPRDI